MVFSESSPTGEAGTNAAQLRVQWRTVAISSLVLALAAVTVTAVVATLQDADTLSVVALALAVLAFVIQIIMFVVQTAAASRQDVRAAEIYGRTLMALATIEEKSEGTRRAVVSMNERLLDAAIGKAVPEVQAEHPEGSSDVLAAGVSARVREILERNESERIGSGARRVRRGPPRRHPDLSMNVFPDEPSEAAVSTLEALRPSALTWLLRLGEDQARLGGASRSDSVGPGLRTINPYTAPDLHEAGLIRRVIVPWSAEPVFQLTDRGKEAARLLMADPPPNAPPRIMALRQRLADDQARQARESRKLHDYPGIPVGQQDAD